MLVDCREFGALLSVACGYAGGDLGKSRHGRQDVFVFC
jgi:hypothetical protein